MKCGVLLGGCGFQDGSEIHETVFCLHSLQKHGVEIVPLSLKENQNKVVDHLSGETLTESRNMMTEAARLTRGIVYDLSDYDSSLLEALVMPGGFGCALNFSDFATKAGDMLLHPKVQKLLVELHQAQTPLGAVCISPVLVAKALGASKPLLTVGDNNEVEACLESFGAKAIKCKGGECVVDHKNKIVTSPAYMYDKASLLEVSSGIDKMVEALVKFS